MTADVIAVLFLAGSVVFALGLAAWAARRRLRFCARAIVCGPAALERHGRLRSVLLGVTRDSLRWVRFAPWFRQVTEIARSDVLGFRTEALKGVRRLMTPRDMTRFVVTVPGDELAVRVGQDLSAAVERWLRQG